MLNKKAKIVKAGLTHTPRLLGSHVFACAATGSGMSYTAKYIAARSIANGMYTVIIDPESEYRKINK
ncbi:helicase HerA domain-containing protein [Desulforamulus putei]|nr:DUF87 domain-containing protein [Desulforamulus putei]